MRNRWARRLVGAVVAFVGLYVALTLLDTEPEPIRLALLVGTCVALLGLMYDALGGGEPGWSVEVDRPSAREGGDPRLVRNVALLEGHQSARLPDHALRDRLAVLTDEVLRQRYGLRRDDPAAAEMLGPELTGVLTGPARRLDPTEIDRCLTRIEEL